MIAHSEWQGGSIFEGTTANGSSIFFDTHADHADGPNPMEAVLMALCACTSVDVVSILQKKRQPVLGLRVSATAEQAPEPPRMFTHIKLTYAVSGRVSRQAAERAVELSKGKYCSVSKMLEKSATIEFEVVIVDEEEQP
jgi:putative redox protein